jgi:putative ABC transport system ATP-binding protein
MVTHDPIIATYADRVVFLKDGAVVDAALAPTVDDVLHRMTSLGG